MEKGQWAYDLHIHSALSPCADNEMTPNNIINMAQLKGLDIIAVTDHNSAQNLPAVFKVGKGKEILIIPGIEVTTKEEVHLLCYFPSLDLVLDFDKKIKSHLPPIPNKKSIFGDQIILNEKDEITGEVEYLLINALDLSIDEIYKEVEKREGVIVPAHVDRKSFSMISNLGFIPPHLLINTLEISKNCNKNDINLPKEYQFIQSSDAHYLGDILERKFFIGLKKLNIENVLHYLRNYYC